MKCVLFQEDTVQAWGLERLFRREGVGARREWAVLGSMPESSKGDLGGVEEPGAIGARNGTDDHD